MRRQTRLGAPSLALAALLAWNGAVHAQKTAIGPLTLATATSGAAFASGANALASSPARLAWNQDTRTQLLLLSGGVRLGLRPVSPGEVARYSGKVLNARVREEWLTKIEAAGSEEGTTSAIFSPFAFARGRFAFQVTTVAEVAAALNPDAVEALLFGNTGRTGTPATLDFRGSAAEGWGLTTFALGGGFNVDRLSKVTGGEWAVGVTAKFSVGHVLWSALDGGSGSGTDPLSLQGVFPVVATPLGGARGTGLGIDAGVAWRLGPWSVDAFLRDAINTFSWDKDDLQFRRSIFAIDPDSTFEGTEELPVELAPVALRRHVDNFDFPQSFTLSVARRFAGDLRVGIEGTCGPTALESGRAVGLGLDAATSEGLDRCRAGGSLQKVIQHFTFRSGLSYGGLGADLGLGLMWEGSRGLVEVAYGRRVGDRSATGLAIAWGFYFGT